MLRHKEVHKHHCARQKQYVEHGRRYDMHLDGQNGERVDKSCHRSLACHKRHNDITKIIARNVVGVPSCRDVIHHERTYESYKRGDNSVAENHNEHVRHDLRSGRLADKRVDVLVNAVDVSYIRGENQSEPNPYVIFSIDFVLHKPPKYLAIEVLPRELRSRRSVCR